MCEIDSQRNKKRKPRSKNDMVGGVKWLLRCVGAAGRYFIPPLRRGNTGRATQRQSNYRTIPYQYPYHNVPYHTIQHDGCRLFFFHMVKMINESYCYSKAEQSNATRDASARILNGTVWYRTILRCGSTIHTSFFDESGTCASF